MGIIQEEIKHPNTPITLEIVEHTKDEEYEPWDIVNIELDLMTSVTPSQLRELGQWLIDRSKEISSHYTAKGKRRKINNEN